eukprot:TRINITY_DN1517_c0_g1_i1.p1 TRINITY_DN1517_c0_g1~~TRINITY_DN1517_c0_g1_i1.p1  ORF type:complete len:111 (+),score=16.85 TRINITY_DN1517_c0_g1_i1:90-422(+)
MTLPRRLLALLMSLGIVVPGLAVNVTTCPESTWPFKNGSHCCRFPLDELGDEVTYNSSTCYGNHYFKCPEEKCRDVPAQMPASAAVWVSSAFGLAVACAASAAAPSRSST